MIVTTKTIAVGAINAPARALICLLFAALLAGCASGPGRNPTDPLEPFNRQMFAINDGVDRALLKPVAESYRAITPYPVRAGVGNFFNNVEDLWSSLNAVLQLRPKVAAETFMRFNINTFLGFGGVLDIASELGIERHSEDLGKTLGRWGVPSGPYIVMPLFGPSTLRDATTITIENRYDPIAQIDRTRTRNATTVLRLVDTRTGLLSLGNFLDDAALDKYSFTRDAFLQKRRAEIFRPGQEEDDYKPGAEETK